MDWVTIQKKAVAFISRYKYVILVLLVGVTLLLLPSGKEKSMQEQVISGTTDNILSVETQLSQILGSVKGAGKVQVMLSIATGEETLYQTNDKYTSDGERISDNKDTVTITDSTRSQTGLIRRIDPATYSGAIVVCQGADDPVVRLAIIDAVSKITGLRTDKISVMKMK